MKKAFGFLAVMLLLALPGCTRRQSANTVDQGWTESDKWSFWYTSQGSQLLPYPWFLALEQHDNEKLFRDNGHMEDLGYLPNGAWTTFNPDSLPIGFVKGREKAGQWDVLGMTCAACHTSRIDHDGKTLQIEGGPARADFQTMVTRLTSALKATLDDPAKFKRFANRVVSEQAGPRADGLKKDFAQWTERLLERQRNNMPPSPPGFARVDALGNIVNQVVGVDLGIPENIQPPSAPVSYPAIWDAHRQDFVQWNGSAPNVGPGPLLRNVGEVLGVFGSLTFSPDKNHPPFYPASTVDIESLVKIEATVARLRSPLWTSTDFNLPPLDEKKVSAGAKIYDANCSRCHKVTDRTNLLEAILVGLTPVSVVGTDGTQAEGFLSRTAKTGPLKGTPISGGLDPLRPDRFGDQAAVAYILRNTVIGVMNANLTKVFPTLELESPKKAFEKLDSLIQEKNARRSFFSDPPQLKTPMYKSRPHNGLWATAPYLHNGSVPNLWAMLQDPAQRPKKFYVGSRKFDSKNVGFDSSEPKAANGVPYFEFDTSLPGNSNKGHIFGTKLTDEEKWMLIEYLKSL